MTSNNLTHEDIINSWLNSARDSYGHLRSGEWMADLIPHLKLHAIVPPSGPTQPHPTVILKYTVQAAHCNRHGTLHGGAAATLFDFCTTLPLALLGATEARWPRLGVSRTLAVSYLRPARPGQRVRIECEVVGRVGRVMCVLRGTMRDEESGGVVAVCEHGKFNVDAERGRL